VTFSQGVSLPDPEKLFNAGLEGNRWRAIDFHEGDKIDEPALKRPDSRCRGSQCRQAGGDPTCPIAIVTRSFWQPAE
jgi:hypothetical protein